MRKHVLILELSDDRPGLSKRDFERSCLNLAARVFTEAHGLGLKADIRDAEESKPGEETVPCPWCYGPQVKTTDVACKACRSKGGKYYNHCAESKPEFPPLPGGVVGSANPKPVPVGVLPEGIKTCPDCHVIHTYAGPPGKSSVLCFRCEQNRKKD